MGDGANLNQQNSKYKYLWTALKIVLGLGLLALVLRRIQWRELQQSWQAIWWLPFGLIIPFRFLILSARAWRWAVLLGHNKPCPTVRELTRVLLKAGLFNNLLPSTAGGDVYRVVATRSTCSTPAATAAVLADRVLGMLALILSVVIVLAVNPWVRQSYVGQAVGAVAAMAVGGVALLWVGRYKVGQWLRGRAEGNNGTRRAVIFSHMWRHFQALADYANRPRQLAQALLFSVTPVAGIVVSTYLLCLSVGAVPGALDLVTIALTVAVISLLPVFINGLGGREAAFIFMFQSVGVSSSQALLIALLSRAGAVIMAIIAVLVYLYDSSRAPEQSRPAAGTEEQKPRSVIISRPKL